MNLSNFKLFEKEYDDVRFGPVDIYQHLHTNELHMVKQITFTNKEEFQNNMLFYKARKKFKNPYLWEMNELIIDEKNLTITSRFIYPNEDLFSYVDVLQKPEGMIHFLTDSLKALNVLEKNQFIHGSLRPESLFFSQNKNSFALIDRIFDAGVYYQNVLIDYILIGEHIYVSPELFKAILQKQQIKQSVYQQDTFCLGMIVAAVLIEDEVVQQVYDIQNQEFNFDALGNIKMLIMQQYKDDYKILGDFICQILLNENPQRDLPSQALNILKRIKLELDSKQVKNSTFSDKRIPETKKNQKDSSFKENNNLKKVKVAKMSFGNQKSNESLEREKSECEDDIQIQESELIIKNDNVSQNKTVSQRQTIQSSNFSFNYEDLDANKEQDDIFKKLLKQGNKNTDKMSLDNDIAQSVNKEKNIIMEEKESEESQEEKLQQIQSLKVSQQKDKVKNNLVLSQKIIEIKNMEDDSDQLSGEEIEIQKQEQNNLKKSNQNEKDEKCSQYEITVISSGIQNDKISEKSNRFVLVNSQPEKIIYEFEEKDQEKNEIKEQQWIEKEQSQPKLNNNIVTKTSQKIIYQFEDDGDDQDKNNNKNSKIEIIDLQQKDESKESLVGLKSKQSQYSIGSDFYQKNEMRNESSTLFNVIRQSNQTNQIDDQDQDDQIEPGMFKKNVNEKEEVYYLADSHPNITDMNQYSRLTEKVYYNIEIQLVYKKYIEFLQQKNIEEILNENDFDIEKQNFKKNKNSITLKIEQNKKLIQENTVQQNLELFKSIYQQKICEKTFYLFLQQIFIDCVDEEKKIIISQADLIEFDQIQNEKNQFSEEDQIQIEKKYSDISHLNPGNSFQEKSNKEEIQYIEIKEVQTQNSQKGILRVKNLIEKNQSQVNKSQKVKFENIYNIQSERVLNKKFSSNRNIDKDNKKINSQKQILEITNDLVNIKKQNQNLFQPFAFIGDEEDFKKGFHSEQNIEKIKISFKNSASDKKITKKDSNKKIKKKKSQTPSKNSNSDMNNVHYQQLMKILKEINHSSEQKNFKGKEFLKIQEVITILEKYKKKNQGSAKKIKKDTSKQKKKPKKKFEIQNSLQLRIHHNDKKINYDIVRTSQIRQNKTEKTKKDLKFKKYFIVFQMKNKAYSNRNIPTQISEKIYVKNQYVENNIEVKNKPVSIDHVKRFTRKVPIDQQSQSKSQIHLKSEIISSYRNQDEYQHRPQVKSTRVSYIPHQSTIPQNRYVYKVGVNQHSNNYSHITTNTLPTQYINNGTNYYREYITDNKSERYSTTRYLPRESYIRRKKNFNITNYPKYFNSMKNKKNQKINFTQSEQYIENFSDNQSYQIHVNKQLLHSEDDIPQGMDFEIQEQQFSQSQVYQTESEKLHIRKQENQIPLKKTESKKFQRDIDDPLQQNQDLFIKKQVQQNRYENVKIEKHEPRRFGSKSPVRIRKINQDQFLNFKPSERAQFYRQQPNIDREKIVEVQSYLEKQSRLSYMTKSDIGKDEENNSVIQNMETEIIIKYKDHNKQDQNQPQEKWQKLKIKQYYYL